MPVLSTDRRAVRTRAALRDALAAEIEAAGDLSRVTATAVADRAGVTRRTFYSHYRDIPDLVSSVEGDAIDEIRPFVRALSDVRLPQLADALDHARPCPGSVELLQALADRPYLGALLGQGGDPRFASRLEEMVREEVTSRALDGIDVRVVGPIFDYYLTYTISAEVGVVVRWLAGGALESADTMARLMTALMFVRPGDLYGKPINLDIPSFVLASVAFREEFNA